MTTEDLTTYTKVDPNSRFTVTASKVIATGICRNEEAYVYKDKGASHFSGDFSHLLSVYPNSTTNQSMCGIWALTNTIGADNSTTRASNNIQLFLYYHDGQCYLYGREWYTGNNYDASQALNNATEYYLTIARVGTAWTCKIYNAVDRAVEHLVATLSLNLHSTEAYRYIYTLRSQDDGAGASAYSCFDENLDLQEVTYAITGITRDASGNILGSCTVLLYNASTKAYVASTTSNGTTGAYSFTGLPDTSTTYFVVAFKSGSPDVEGATDNNLTGS